MRWLSRVTRMAVAVLVAAMLNSVGAKASTMPVTARHVHVQPEGLPALDVYIEDVGRGRPVVLLHGLGGSGYLWRHIVADLARTHRVITIDMMGFGRSDKPLHGHYAPADHARVIAATLRALDLRNVALAGHSLGGLVALFVAMDAERDLARRITRLMLFSAPALPQPVNGAVRFLSQPVIPYLALSLLPPDTVARIGLLSGAGRMAHITDTDISFYADPLRGLGGAHAIIQSARQIAPADPRPILRRYKAIRQPILVSGCREDRTVPISTAEALSRYLPNARLAVLENCDHMPMEQNPAAVIKAMRRFLAR
jgi:pimeloyl-ACP methyl ester carboxylesterase